MNGPAGWSASPWVEAVGWMLLHSLWQGAGVALALAVVLGLLRRAPSPARYLVACAAMVLMVALPGLTLLRSGVSHPSPRAGRVSTAEPAVIARMTPILDDLGSIPRPAPSRIVDRIEPMLPMIVAVWMAGVGGFSLRLLGGWIQARRWVRCQTRPLADPWPDRVERLKERLGLRRAVALLESARIEVPMVVGWVRPAVLVPVAAVSGLTVAELEAILAHELAHIRRHDYLVNVIQCVVEVVMFYHPAAWWVSGAIRRERESCCDDLAVSVCRDRVTYARALAAMEGLRVPAFSVSTAANGGVLLARVRRVLKPQEESMNPVRILAGLAVVLAAAPLWLARGNSDEPGPAAPDKAPVAATSPGSFPSLPVVEKGATERQEPFPDRSFADLLTTVEEAPTGRFIAAAGPKRTRTVANQKLDTTPGPIVEGDSDRSVQCLDPPSEAEVLAKLPKTNEKDPAAYKTQRNNVRVVVEKIADKVNAVKDYSLAGPCQLVHCHYKCTVSYDQLYWSDYPIPFNHVDHKVEIVYIDKDHLRRVPGPGQASWDRTDQRTADRADSIRQTRKWSGGAVAEIKIWYEGHVTITPEKTKVELLSQVGQPFDPQRIDTDVKSLMRTNVFSQVDAYQEESPPGSGKHALIFVVREMPVLTHVEFRGRKAIRLEEIEDATLLKKGNRADPIRTRNAVHSILRLYQDKGYELAQVELLEGGNPGDTRVVLQIFEGPRVKIGSIDFVGCQFATPAILRTRIAGRPEDPGLSGMSHRDLLDEDRQKLIEYYQAQGFLEAQVTPVTRKGANPGEIELTFKIKEGLRYSVRKAIIEGNSRIKTEALTADLELHSGRPFLLTMRDADRRRLLSKYTQIGCIDTKISVEPRFIDQPGVVDLVYRIEEGEPYVLGELDIQQIDRMIEKLQGLRRELGGGRKDAAVSPASGIR